MVAVRLTSVTPHSVTIRGLGLQIDSAQTMTLTFVSSDQSVNSPTVQFDRCRLIDLDEAVIRTISTKCCSTTGTGMALCWRQ